MQGQIIKFDDRIGSGVIRTDAGHKYRFQKSNVQNPNGILVGHDVDFLVESRQPREIILLAGSPWSVFAASSHA